MIPAIKPITTAAQTSTKAQDAVMATKPANAPFKIVGISGFPKTTQEINVAATAPAPAAKFVLSATKPKNAIIY